MDGDVRTASASPLPKLVNVIGTSNVPLGYRIRNIKPHKVKKIKMPDPKIEAIQEYLETDRKIGLLMHDERLHERKLHKLRVEKAVDQGMRAYEEDLEERRDKLRELLAMEEAELIRELIELALKLEEEHAEELAIRVAEAEEQREAERQELLHGKHLQHFVEGNQELREARRRARVEDAKCANKMQMADNEEKRKMESDEEAYWHQVMLDRCNAEAAIEAKGAAIREDNTRKMVEILREQMEAKSRNQLPEKVPDTSLKILPSRNPLEEKQIQDEKNRKLREGLAAQLSESRLVLEKRRKEEEALKEMTWNLGKVVDPSSPEYRMDVEARRKEVQSYMENMQKFREALAQREAEADECLCLWTKESDEKKRLALQTARENRKKADLELKLAWDHQVQDKRNREEQDLEPAYDPELTSAHEATWKRERANRRLAAKEYGRELLSQHEEHEARRFRELRDLEEKFRLRMAEQERQEREFAKEVEELGPRLRMSGIP